MHRFWQIDEMIRVVASDLNERCWAYGPALALACCSKQLSDIVLDSLWEELICLRYPMRCLPQESWEIRENEFVRTACSSSFAGGHLKPAGLLTLPLH